MYGDTVSSILLLYIFTYVYTVVTAALLWYGNINFNLQFGFGPYLITFVIIIIYNYILNTSLSEMLSAMPTSGGIIGYTRLSCGLLASFLCGVGMVIDMVTSSAFAAILWATYICNAVGYVDDVTGDPMPIAIVYFAIVAISFSSLMILAGKRYIWTYMLFSTVITILIALLLFFTGIIYGNFQHNAYNTNLMVTWTDDNSRRRLTVAMIHPASVTGSPTGTPSSRPSVYIKDLWFLSNITRGFYKSLVTNFWK